MVKPFFLFALFCCIFFESCQQNFELTSDQTLCEIFSRDEIDEIQKIIDFVDGRLIQATGEANVVDAYHSCFHQFAKEGGNCIALRLFSPEDKTALKGKLAISICNEFWIPDGIRAQLVNAGVSRGSDLDYSSLSINPIGRFQSYLKKTGEEDVYYKNLYKSILMNGDLSVADVLWFNKHHDDFDFNLPKNRLWAAVYLLRISNTAELSSR